MKRLNGWQRIGIILSVIWLVGGGLLVHQIARDAGGEITASDIQVSDADMRALLANDLS